MKKIEKRNPHFHRRHWKNRQTKLFWEIFMNEFLDVDVVRKKNCVVRKERFIQKKIVVPALSLFKRIMLIISDRGHLAIIGWGPRVKNELKLMIKREINSNVEGL